MCGNKKTKGFAREKFSLRVTGNLIFSCFCYLALWCILLDKVDCNEAQNSLIMLKIDRAKVKLCGESEFDAES